MSARATKVKQIKIKPSKFWPEQVNILGAKDMFEGKLSNRSRTKHCLLGHCAENFDVFSDGFKEVKDLQVLDIFTDALNLAGKFITGYRKGSRAKISIVLWNDALCRYLALGLGMSPNALRARIWNLGMAILGYTEGNPEAQHVKGA